MAASSLGRCFLLSHSRAFSRAYLSKCQLKRLPTITPTCSRWFSQEGEPGSGYRYAKSHEYVSVGESKLTTIGVSNYAQEKLGDVVYVELPEVGDEVEKGAILGVLESVKAAADINTPVSGTVAEVNTSLKDSPELVNEDSYQKGWLVKMKDVDPEETKELMSADEYTQYLEEGVV